MEREKGLEPSTSSLEGMVSLKTLTQKVFLSRMAERHQNCRVMIRPPSTSSSSPVSARRVPPGGGDAARMRWVPTPGRVRPSHPSLHSL